MQNEREKFKEHFVKRLIAFSVRVLRFAEEMKSHRVLWPVADQLVRSATSVGANIVEAKSSSSRRDYIHFFEIALKSANETKYWLTVLAEYAVDGKQEITALYQEVDELSRIIGSSLLTLKGRK